MNKDCQNIWIRIHVFDHLVTHFAAAVVAVIIGGLGPSYDNLQYLHHSTWAELIYTYCVDYCIFCLVIGVGVFVVVAVVVV
jgi:hypothetical protein